MKVTFSTLAWESYLYWQQNDKKIVKRINLLIKDIQRTPYEGIGKPEPLKHGLSGYWSRRINDEHRMVYKHQDSTIYIAQLRYHYSEH
ncbi:MAG: Txe/YoeB family addiction module toxin [Mariprofundales bacterium]